MEVIKYNFDNTLCLTENTSNHDFKLDLNNVPVPKDLKELLSMLSDIFARDTVNVDYVKELMSNYKSNPRDWRQYAKYDPHK